MERIKKLLLVKEGIIEEVALQIYDWYKKLPSKVFKRFLKRVMDYFDDQSKGKYDYKNWFLSKKPLNVLEERQKNFNQLLGM